MVLNQIREMKRNNDQFVEMTKKEIKELKKAIKER